MENLNFVIAIVALIISIITAYWQFFRKPNLHIIYKDEEPYRKYLIIEGSRQNHQAEWFIRIKIMNTRRVIAKKCFGKLVEWYTNGKALFLFDPIKLHWVSNDPTDYSQIDLSYQEFDYLDIFYTDKNLSKLKIYTNSKPRGLPIDNLRVKDEHIFKIAIYCENEVSKFKYFRSWYDKNSQDKLLYPRVEEIEKRDLNKYISAPNNLLNRKPTAVA